MTSSATIYEVAAAANVSVRTVSRYLNDPNCVSTKTSALIVGAMQALKYRPSIAARIIQCLHKRQIAVPDQVSVLGFDDHPMLVHATDPPLTSVRLPYLQMGMRAAQLACDPSQTGKVKERCDVQTRASVAGVASGGRR